MKLFVIYIGGVTATSLIELHDMRFVVAHSIEETYHALRNTWWGTPESLHLDAWGELIYADGYDITINHTNNHPDSAQEEKLFFLNLGGYDSKQFTELHHNVFIVAKDKQTAKIKAKAQIQHWEVPHTDNNLEVENIISVDECIEKLGCNLILTKTERAKPFVFTCKYTPIGMKSESVKKFEQQPKNVQADHTELHDQLSQSAQLPIVD